MKTNNMEKLDRTWLVQRLRKPMVSNPTLQSLGEAFSFGGGLVNGGLSKEAMSLLRPVFSFDYMGSAEFEWGAVPACFQRIAKEINSYGTWSVNIGNKIVYVIGCKNLESDITTRIIELSKNKIHLKEYCGLKEACEQKSSDELRFIGWLELDNAFMFFIDKKAFNGTCDLFGLKMPE